MNSQRSPRFHADRAAGRDRHHRRADRPAAARRAGGPRGGPPCPVRQQPEADRPGPAQLPRRHRLVPDGASRAPFVYPVRRCQSWATGAPGHAAAVPGAGSPSTTRSTSTGRPSPTTMGDASTARLRDGDQPSSALPDPTSARPVRQQLLSAHRHAGEHGDLDFGYPGDRHATAAVAPGSAQRSPTSPTAPRTRSPSPSPIADNAQRAPRRAWGRGPGGRTGAATSPGRQHGGFRRWSRRTAACTAQMDPRRLGPAGLRGGSSAAMGTRCSTP